MRILSCTIYDTYASHHDNPTTTSAVTTGTYSYGIMNHNNNDNDKTTAATSMSTLTCQLLLDCLLPSPNDDEPLTYLEQFEVLEDLQHFLFTTDVPDDNFIIKSTNLEKLHISHQKAITDALIVIHEKSSLAVARNGNSKTSNTDDAKRLTDLCRSMITKIAITTERIPIHKNMDIHPWYTMVEEPVRKLSQHLFDQADIRINIAYIACVTASGGYKTLTLCLECGLTKLLNFNPKKGTVTYNSDETLITTIYGIGAFFASCRSALNVALRDGIHWYPHPLVPYCNEALQLTLDYSLDDEPHQVNDTAQLQVQIAAIRALESILMVSPITSLTPERINEVVTCLSKLSSNVIDRKSVV